MPKITINLAETGLVPAGEYTVEVQRVTLRDKIDGDSQYLHFDLAVAGGQHDGERLDTIASLRPDMVQLLGRTLAALGIEPGEVEIETSEDEDGLVLSPDFVGKRAIAVVTHKQVGSQTYARVRTLKAMPKA